MWLNGERIAMAALRLAQANTAIDAALAQARDNDEICAIAGIEAIGLIAIPGLPVEVWSQA
jgi:hypothetical protein